MSQQERQEIAQAARAAGLDVDPTDIQYIDGFPLIDGTDPAEWIHLMTTED